MQLETLSYTHVSACIQAAQNWLAIFQGLASDFVDYRQCFHSFEQMTVGNNKSVAHAALIELRHHRMSSPYIVKLPVHVVRFTQKCISVIEACCVTEIQMQVYLHYTAIMAAWKMFIQAWFNILYLIQFGSFVGCMHVALLCLTDFKPCESING